MTCRLCGSLCTKISTHYLYGEGCTQGPLCSETCLAAWQLLSESERVVRLFGELRTAHILLHFVSPTVQRDVEDSGIHHPHFERAKRPAANCRWCGATAATRNSEGRMVPNDTAGGCEHCRYFDLDRWDIKIPAGGSGEPS